MAGQVWFFYAFGAALLWGAGYVFSEKILHAGVSGQALMFIYVAIATPIFLMMSVASKTLKPSLDVILSNQQILLYFGLIIFCYVLGNYLIFKSVAMKNATYVGLIEISYPIFTIFFSWLFFREFHLTPTTILGAVMIFAGTMLVLWKG